VYCFVVEKNRSTWFDSQYLMYLKKVKIKKVSETFSINLRLNAFLNKVHLSYSSLNFTKINYFKNFYINYFANGISETYAITVKNIKRIKSINLNG